MGLKKNKEFKLGEIVVYPKHGVGEIQSIETLSLHRGMESNLKNAESFELIRSIRN